MRDVGRSRRQSLTGATRSGVRGASRVERGFAVSNPESWLRGQSRKSWLAASATGRLHVSRDASSARGRHMASHRRDSRGRSGIGGEEIDEEQGRGSMRGRWWSAPGEIRDRDRSQHENGGQVTLIVVRGDEARIRTPARNDPVERQSRSVCTASERTARFPERPSPSSSLLDLPAWSGRSGRCRSATMMS